MSNQRSGKWKSATLRDGSGMQTVTFFKNAKKVLEEYGHGRVSEVCILSAGIPELMLSYLIVPYLASTSLTSAC